MAAMVETQTPRRHDAVVGPEQSGARPANIVELLKFTMDIFHCRSDSLILFGGDALATGRQRLCDAQSNIGAMLAANLLMPDTQR